MDPGELPWNQTSVAHVLGNAGYVHFPTGGDGFWMKYL